MREFFIRDTQNTLRQNQSFDNVLAGRWDDNPGQISQVYG